MDGLNYLKKYVNPNKGQGIVNNQQNSNWNNNNNGSNCESCGDLFKPTRFSDTCCDVCVAKQKSIEDIVVADTKPCPICEDNKIHKTDVCCRQCCENSNKAMDMMGGGNKDEEIVDTKPCPICEDNKIRKTDVCCRQCCENSNKSMDMMGGGNKDEEIVDTKPCPICEDNKISTTDVCCRQCCENSNKSMDMMGGGNKDEEIVDTKPCPICEDNKISTTDVCCRQCCENSNKSMDMMGGGNKDEEDEEEDSVKKATMGYCPLYDNEEETYVCTRCDNPCREIYNNGLYCIFCHVGLKMNQ